jgi:WD40 repeat protein
LFSLPTYTQSSHTLQILSVSPLAWSPDGAALAGGRVTLWNPDGKVIDIRGAEGLIDYLAWSPDSQHLAGINRASNAPTNKIFLWNRTDRELVTLVGHEQVVTALAWSPDGTLLASGSLDRTIRLWTIGKSR